MLTNQEAHRLYQQILERMVGGNFGERFESLVLSGRTEQAYAELHDIVEPQLRSLSKLDITEAKIWANFRIEPEEEERIVRLVERTNATRPSEEDKTDYSKTARRALKLGLTQLELALSKLPAASSEG